MFILFETVPSNDPRLDPRIVIKNAAWHYSIAQIEESVKDEVILSWLDYAELSPEESECYRFFNVLDGEVPVMVNKSNPKDLIEPTSYGDNDYEKVLYKLTQTDKDNTVSLMKKVMTLHARNHSSDETTKNRLLQGISALRTVEETQMFFATYFEWECAYTATKDKVQDFETRWSWGEELRLDTDNDKVLLSTVTDKDE